VAEPIQDKHVVAVLRPFVRATTPMLAALRESDPLGLVRRVLPAAREVDGGAAPDGLAGEDARQLGGVERGLRERLADGLESMRVPGTAAWGRMSVEERDDWWVNRVGRFTVLLAAIPGLGGAFADRLPVQDTLALAGQGLLLCAIAAEHGVTADADRVRLLASVLFQRDVEPALAARPADRAAEDRETAELTEELTESTRKHGRITVRAAGRTLWRFGRTLWALGDELDKRPQGRFYHRALGAIPVVGIAGDYFGERSALKRAAKSARRWLAAQN
jgi:hypothetical protein